MKIKLVLVHSLTKNESKGIQHDNYRCVARFMVEPSWFSIEIPTFTYVE